MKSSVLAALALVLALALALVLWLTNKRDAGSPPISRPDATAEASAHQSPVLDATSASKEALAEVAGAAQKRAEAQSLVAAGPALSITGRIAPEGICVDDQVEVYALAYENDFGDLDQMLDKETKTGVKDSRFLGRARAEANGSFRIEIASDTSHAHVHARGRYLYTHDSVPVDLKTLDPIVLVPLCGACVEGRIAPPAGTEAIGEEIDLELETSIETAAALQGGGDRVSRKFHSKDGHFEFRALATNSGYELSFEPEKYPAHHEQVVGLIPGQTRVVDLRLQNGGKLRGIVRGADGAPVASATVEAKRKGRWFGFDDTVIRSRESGADGTFELPAVALGSVLVTAKREGLLGGDPLKVDVADGATVEGLVVTLGEGNSIRGTLTWADGKPASGARIDVEFDKSHLVGMESLNAARGASGKATSDAAGHFTVSGLGVGPFTVKAEVLPPMDPALQTEAAPKTAESRSEREKLMHRARVDEVKPGTQELALVLAAPTILRGHVVDKAQQPIKTGHVKATTVGSGMLKNFGQEQAEATVNKENGEFVITLTRNGAWSLVVSAEGYADSEPIEVTLPRKAGESALVVTLEKSGIVMGLVLDPQGVRVPGATVEISTGDPDWMRVLSNAMSPTAKSDTAGKFTLDGVKPGHLALVASSKDWARSLDVPLDLAPGETRDGVVLTLREGGRLTGEVYENGKPGASMLVQVTLLKTYSQRAAFSDAAGRFDVPHLEAGSYQVVALHTGALEGATDGADSNPAEMLSKMKMASADIKDGEVTHVVLGAPPKDPVHVHGRVMHAGAPYTGAMIVFMGESKDVLASMKSSGVAADGSYSVELESPGHYAVMVQRTSGKPGEQQNIEFSRTVPAVKDLELDFAMPTGRISGRVLGADGQPAAGASVTISPDHGVETGSLFGGQFSLSSTDAEGRYDLAALKPGSYSVSAGGSPFGGMLGDTSTHGRALRTRLRVTEGSWLKDIDFRLDKACSVTVTVVDDQDRPVTGANVFARDAEGQLVDAISMLATSPDGTAKYPGLAPGHYTFSARHEGRASGESSRVEVEAGSTKAVKLSLLAATVLVVRVVDKDDKPADAYLTVLDEKGREVASMTGLDEMTERFRGGGTSHAEQRVGPLPPGKYRVHAARADGKSCEKPVTLSGQAERTINLQFSD